MCLFIIRSKMSSNQPARRARAHVFSIGGAHMLVVGRLVGLVRCAMMRPPSRYTVYLTLIEDGSEERLHLPYTFMLDMQAELERVQHKRRLRARREDADGATRALFFELGLLKGSNAYDADRGDRIIIIVGSDGAALAEELRAYQLAARVVAADAVAAVDAFWRDRELQWAQRDETLQNAHQTLENTDNQIILLPDVSHPPHVPPPPPLPLPHAAAAVNIFDDPPLLLNVPSPSESEQKKDKDAERERSLLDEAARGADAARALAGAQGHDAAALPARHALLE